MKPLPPHWKLVGSVKRCSVCGYPLPQTLIGGALDAAFKEHLSKAHKPGQTSEDFSQAAVRIVRETTESH